MKKLNFIIILFTLSYFNASARNNNILDVDFMQSMTDGNPEGEKLLTADPQRSHYLKIFQKNYDTKKPSKMPYSEDLLIPKIMHHVWIGGGDMPPLYQNYLDECKKMHPDWEFKIWDDKGVEKLGLIYKDLYDKMRGYVVKADVLRYEVLYRFGGVYRDMDVKCLRPIDDLNHLYDFYASLDVPFHGYAAINNGSIGSKPNHPILKNILDSINRDIDSNLYAWDNDSRYKNDVWPYSFAYPFTFNPFSDEFVKQISLNDKSIALPTSYYFSVLYHDAEIIKSKKLGFLDFNVKMHFSDFKPEALMWHNTFKGEIRASGFLEANGREGWKDIKKTLKTMSPLEQKKFNTYKAVYENNAPNRASWSKKSKIPQIINFVVFSNDELKKLQEHLPTWQMLNFNFELKIWDQSKIIENFPDLKKLFQSSLDENMRFYVGLKILEKFGGSYADFKAIAHMPIFEFHNKYNFYAGLRPLKKNKIITLSSKLIGANQNNPIISIVLSKINSDNLSQLDEVLAFEVYKNIFLYGKNIVMPAMYFESLDSETYSFSDKIADFKRFVPNMNLHPNEYSIIE